MWYYYTFREVDEMKVWQSLYGIIWLMFISLLLQSKVVDLPYIEYLHMALGAGVLALAFSNYANVSKTEAPARTKRILKTIASLSLVMMFLGVIVFIEMLINYNDAFLICNIGIVRFLHLGLSITIIAQASSAATSYDMWEEKEFLPKVEPAGVEPEGGSS